MVAFFNSLNSFKNRWLWGVLISVVFVFAGISYEHLNAEVKPFPKREVVISGNVLENPKVNAGSYRICIRVNAILDSGIWQAADHKVVCTLQKKSGSVPGLNQRIFLKTNFKEIKNFGNPFEFDYKTYMNRNGYFYTAFVDSGNWFIKGKNSHFSLTMWALEIRDMILNYYKQLNLPPSSFAVISALTVGDKRYLDDETKMAYVNSGTIHILAVSGMHVGLLFWLLQQLFRPLMFFKKGKLLRSIAVLVFIWIYALITGLTPSVVRASVMFSFWIIGDTSNRKTNIYNTICASAFLLLIIDPDTIYDVGFQLSYLAVIGIVVFYKDIFNWFYVKNFVLKHVWSWIAVSLAAQLFTLPVTLYNFHQFPNYFLLSNIIALPLSTVILYGSLATLLVIPFKFLWIPAGWFLKILIGWMNGVLIWIEHLPFSISKGIWISEFMTVLLFGIIISFCCYIYFKRTVFVYILLTGSILFSLNIFIKRYKIEHSHEIALFNEPRSFSLYIRNGHKSLWIKDSISFNDERVLKPIRDHMALKEIDKACLHNIRTVADKNIFLYKNFIFYNGLKFYIWEQKPKLKRRPVKIDYLIIHRIRNKDIRLIDSLFKVENIIITSNVYSSNIAEIDHYFSMSKSKVFALSTDGAWVLDNYKKNDK
jgi:competence protein ComEC